MKKTALKKDYRKRHIETLRQLRKAYRDLKESHIEMIFRLALLAEQRDPLTGRHLVRIADYSSIIAEGMGLPRKDIDIIRHASPMHDIGKIMLPDSILKHHGKLTGAQKKTMQRHPFVGSDIFKNANSPLTRACGEIALTHHEKFDGTGYPAGLKGKKIPLYGRIVGLADYFDAVASKRAYKKAVNFEQAVSMVLERSGTYFDPEVVAAFARKKDAIKQAWQANRDIEDFVRSTGKNAKKHV